MRRFKCWLRWRMICCSYVYNKSIGLFKFHSIYRSMSFLSIYSCRTKLYHTIRYTPCRKYCMITVQQRDEQRISPSICQWCHYYEHYPKSKYDLSTYQISHGQNDQQLCYHTWWTHSKYRC